MKRNQAQIDKGTILLLSKRLPSISEDAMHFCKNPFDFTISYQKWGKRADKAHIYWCCSCGEEYHKNDLTDLRPHPDYNPRSYYVGLRKSIATCPHCGKTMHIIENWSRNRHFQDIVLVRSIFGEWSVDRYLLSECYSVMGSKEKVYVSEIGQVWSRGEGQKAYCYFAQRGGMFYSKYWKPNKPFHFVNAIPEDAQHVTTWRGVDTYEYPADFSLEDELARRGIDIDNFHGMPLTDILSCMAYTPYFETLWKAGEYELAKFFKKDLPRYWAQIKIVRRQGYKIEDLNKWRDMVDMLRELRDIHSPKYICPADLETAHDQAVVLKNRQLHKTESERDKEYDKILKRRIAKFLDMDIHDENIQIIVLPSVQAFKDETDHLCHCVYTCAYYKKETSLILSARDANNKNKRWETIEVGLNDFTIRQCYGYGDKFTKFHKEIEQLMNANMWQVRQRMAA